MNSQDSLPDSFVGRTEKFYVLRNEGLALPRQYAQYSSPTAYNLRSEIPIYVGASDALADFSTEVRIYPESLTTTPPVYPAEHDEVDLGLTPARNIWAERFASAKAATRHAA